MSDLNDAPPPSEPRYRIEANTWEELLEQLQQIAPEAEDFSYRSRGEDRAVAPESVVAPERASHHDFINLANEMTQRLQSLPPQPDLDETQSVERSDWFPHRRSEPGSVLRRTQRRRERQIESEAGYVWLHEAMTARDLADRNAAIQAMEQVKDVARLERLAEHSTQRTTRRAALDALARLKAVAALESAALYIRVEVFAPKKTKPIGGIAGAADDAASAAPSPDFHDDTRDHAVDLLSRLASDGIDDALEALKRIALYDFAPDSSGRIRALRRLGSHVDRLEARKDWLGLSILYRETRNNKIRRDIAERLSHHLHELEERKEIDALLAVADLASESGDQAERAVQRIERPHRNP